MSIYGWPKVQYSRTSDEQHTMVQSKKCCSRQDVARRRILILGMSGNKLCSFALERHKQS